jgi:shikimate dehydrogenase
MPYLDFISDEAKAIGAVNTVVRKDGRLYGYNTDYFGFDYMLTSSKIDPKGKKARVLGRGGASVTVCAVLRDRGAREICVLGSKDNTEENIRKNSDAEIIVNASPVGMYPNNGVSVVDISLFPRPENVKKATLKLPICFISATTELSTVKA